jgi:hypothetical protein
MILECPGLQRPANSAPTWTDSTGRLHDLLTERLITYAEAAADPLLADLGFATEEAIGALVNTGRLYPAWRKNPRVIRIYRCGLADFRRRQLSLRPTAAA